MYGRLIGISFAITGNLLTIVPEIRAVLGRLKRELLDPVLVTTNTKKSSETQTTTPEPQRPIEEIPGLLPNSTPDVLRVQPRWAHHQNWMEDFPICNYVNNIWIIFFLFRRLDPLRDIGRGDLDPLGRGGGGMIFDPFNRNPDGILPIGPDLRPLPGKFPANSLKNMICFECVQLHFYFIFFIFFSS